MMMKVDGATKRRWKRKLRRRQRDARDLGQQADQKIEKLLIRRFDRLASVKRFVMLWLMLFALLFFATVIQIRALSRYYQTLKPVAGGHYDEGIIGTFTDANPIYATGTADTAVSRLVFSGLFKYDDSNNLVGDLATGYTIDAAQTLYSVHLRHGITWQDGKPFTADDVVFTYKTIQNIQAQSPLYSSWQGVGVTRQNDYTVNFTLPDPLSSFPESLTNGIIPAHLLKKIPPSELRSALFNTAPVGTGPFVWKSVDVSGGDTLTREQRISLAAFTHYWSGRPKLDAFSITTFSDDQHMLTAFKQKRINAMSGLESLPDELKNDAGVQTYVTPLTTAVMSFFNTSRPILNDVSIRKALVSAVDRSQAANITDYPSKLVDSPLLRGQLGYDPGVTELPYNPAYANQLLDQAGWTKSASGQRMKDGRPLVITMSSQDTRDYSRVSQFLQRQWAAVGIKVQVNYYTADDLQTQVIADHNYDILLYGISIGVDPDVFAYWDSSQASITSQGHLNLSEYKSSVADQAIEAARTRSDPQLRAIKYKPFLEAWSKDAPALALYQPNFIYITRGPVFNYQRKAANSGVDRFSNVDKWEIRQQKQTIE